MARHESSARGIKVVLVGDVGTGKSSLAQRFVADDFCQYNEPTIGARFLSKTVVIDNTPIQFQIWDTSGQEKYQSLLMSFYRNAAAAIVVYDITRQQSLATVDQWARQIQIVCSGKAQLAIVGNKSDLAVKRQVLEADARAYAAGIGALFLETSAQDATGVSDLFTQLGRAVIAARAAESAPPWTLTSLFTGGSWSGSFFGTSS